MKALEVLAAVVLSPIILPAAAILYFYPPNFLPGVCESTEEYTGDWDNNNL